ncbi:MAG: Phosphoribosylformylglycinamidine synthase, glutamine amidotransferase subunit, partial [uncultured Rubrobacteraceae bacterium]
EDRGDRLPGKQLRSGRALRRREDGCCAGRAVARRGGPQGGGRRDRARRVLLRRLPTPRRHSPLRGRDGTAGGVCRRRRPGPRRLQRVPGALRGAPAAGGASPEHAHALRLRPCAGAGRDDGDALDRRVRGWGGAYPPRRPQRGELFRGRGDAGASRGGGPGGDALPGEPERVGERHSRCVQRGSERRRDHAAPGARFGPVFGLGGGSEDPALRDGGGGGL